MTPRAEGQRQTTTTIIHHFFGTTTTVPIAIKQHGRYFSYFFIKHIDVDLLPSVIAVAVAIAVSFVAYFQDIPLRQLKIPI